MEECEINILSVKVYIYSNTWNRHSLMGHENGYSVPHSFISSFFFF